MRELIEFVIKVFAIYLGFHAVGSYIPDALMPGAWNMSSSLQIGLFVAGLGMPIGIGIILWVKAPQMAKTAFSVEPSSTRIPLDAFLATAFLILGVYWGARSAGVLLTQLGTGASIHHGWYLVLILSVGLTLGKNTIVRTLRKALTLDKSKRGK